MPEKDEDRTVGSQRRLSRDSGAVCSSAGLAGKDRSSYSEPCSGPDRDGGELAIDSGTNDETNCRISSTSSVRPSAMRSRRRTWAANSAAFAT